MASRLRREIDERENAGTKPAVAVATAPQTQPTAPFPADGRTVRLVRTDRMRVTSLDA